MNYQKLIDWLPYEFEVEFCDTRAYQFINVNIINVNNFCSKKWPGEHKFVFNWVELENGYAVGWNENPARGWSFPIIKIKKEK